MISHFLLGIEAPTDNWTWEDYFQLTRHLQDMGYVVGDLLRLPSIEHIIHVHGGTFISSDYTDFIGYLDSEETNQAFENYLQAISPIWDPFMLSRWGTSPRLTTTWPALGMARSSSLYHLFDSIDGIDREYDIAPMPLTENGERVNKTLLTGLAMTNASQDKELAWEFLKFILEDDDEDTMHFVSNNTLLIQEEHYATRPPAQYEKLLQFIQSESAYAHVSSLSMIPTFVGGKVDVFYNPPWNIPDDVDLSRYLPDLALSLEEIRDKMIERGLGGSVVDYK